VRAMAGKLDMKLLERVKTSVGRVFDEPCGDAGTTTSHVVQDQTVHLELAQLKSVLLQSIDHGAESIGMSTHQVKVQGQLRVSCSRR